MSNQRYPEEFKIEAVKQVTERGLRVADVAERLRTSRVSEANDLSQLLDSPAVRRN